MSSPTHGYAIARHRYHTFFGEDHARISRDQTRFEVIKYERTFVIKLISALLFNLPKTRLAELNDLAADDVAYAIHWREFAVELLRGWRDSSYLVRVTACYEVPMEVLTAGPIVVCRSAHVRFLYAAPMFER